MGIKIGQGFQRTGAFPVDETMILTKAQMISIDDSLMPDKYFTICQDDGKLYLYDKSATSTAETGKFSVMSSGATDINWDDIYGAMNLPMQLLGSWERYKNYTYGQRPSDNHYISEFLYDPNINPSWPNNNGASGERLYYSNPASYITAEGFAQFEQLIPYNPTTDLLCELTLSDGTVHYIDEYVFIKNDYYNEPIYQGIDNRGNETDFYFHIKYEERSDYNAWVFYLIPKRATTETSATTDFFSNSDTEVGALVTNIAFYTKKNIHVVSKYVNDDFDLHGMNQNHDITSNTQIDEIFSRVYGEGAITSQEYYSVGEEVLIGTWKENGTIYDLYRKVIDFGAIPNSTAREVPHGITNYHRFVSIRAISYGGTDVFEMPYAHPESAYAVGVFVRTANNTVVLTTGTARNGYKAMAIIEFTRARG